MSPDERTVRLESLLSQHAWVRALARTLVRDDAAADDLAQEAWLAALRSPPSSAGAVRSWFGTVLRNASRQAHRASSRRERREDAVARPEAQPGPHEIVVRAEEHRRVVDAVLSLDEPSRTTVLLRFFDDLPPREIAARMDVPVETVRARLRRALERMRLQLDGDHGGDGASWRLALLPLAGLPAGAVTGSGGAGSAAAGAKAGAAPASATSLTSSFTTGAIAMSGAKTVAVGVVALVLGAVAGGVVTAGQQGAAREADAKRAQDQVRAVETRIESLAADLRTAQAEAQRARGETAVVAKKLEAAEVELAAEKAKREEAASALARAEERIKKAGGAAPSSGSSKATFVFEEFGDSFGKVDWASVAEHTTAIVDPIRRIVEAVLAGKPVPLDAAGEAQKHNGPLIQAVGVISGQLSGTGPNGAYTHPAFQVNALAAALEKIGKPLSDSQRASLEETGRRFTEEERKRIGAYDDTTFQMKKLVEEGDLKDRFFDRVREILSVAQLDAISPPVTRDRLAADLWSEGLLWVTVTRPVRFEKKEQLAETTSRSLGTMFKLDDAQKAKVAAITADWAARLPQPLVERKPDALEALGMSPADLVADAAAETRKLVERIATDLALSGDQLTAARNWGVVFLPVPGDRDE